MNKTFQNENSSLKRILGIMSGKGGVGKSTLTVMLADSLINHGYKVGILDADITCPSIPTLLNINEVSLRSEDDNIIPYETKTGIKVVSMNMMLTDSKKPVVWRGAILSTVINQFWTKVNWGDIDYLLIDMPPGTSDIALTVLNQIHPHGMIMISVPQDLVHHIVAKAVEMVNQMNIRLIGIILNMSYYSCPICGNDFTLYDGTQKEFQNVRILGQLPANLHIAKIGDNQGVIDEDAGKLIDPITKLIIDEVKIPSLP